MIKLTPKLSKEEFLALPDNDRTYELIEGEAVAKMAPKLNPSLLTGILYTFLRN